MIYIDKVLRSIKKLCGEYKALTYSVEKGGIDVWIDGESVSIGSFWWDDSDQKFFYYKIGEGYKVLSSNLLDTKIGRKILFNKIMREIDDNKRI